jgi:hypothetical protein
LKRKLEYLRESSKGEVVKTPPMDSLTPMGSLMENPEEEEDDEEMEEGA